MRRTFRKKPTSDNYLRVTPLGGLGEIGKNMTVFETKNDIIIVDLGLKFPDFHMLGVDLVLPDVSYLKNKKRNIRGLFVTHGHEDHKGGIQYLFNEIGNPPIYGTKLTQGLISINLKEKKLLDKAKLKIIKTRQEIVLGDFAIEPFRVNHSIPDAVGFIIRTPIGTVVHTGDFKFDFTPPDGQPADISRIAQVGDDGVTLLLSDSTNAEVPGYTESELVLGETLMRVVQDARGRLIIASFASNLNRIQQVINAAHKHGRKVVINGRSMMNNVNIAMELGYLNVPRGLLIPLAKMRSFPDHKIVMITTGSQGETYSVLTRLANKSHRSIQIKKGDTILISATPIPGNEGSVSKVIDGLYRLGAKVIYSKMMDVHVSGHAKQEEHKLMLNLIKPKYFMPVHGERRHLGMHAKMAGDMGIAKDRIFILENGHTLEITKNNIKHHKNNPSGYLLVDGSGIGDIGNVVLKDREIMSKAGIFLAMINIEPKTYRMVGAPEIVSRGFVYMRESQDLLKQSTQLIIETLQRAKNAQTKTDIKTLRGNIKARLTDFLHEQTKRDPMVMVVLTEV